MAEFYWESKNGKYSIKVNAETLKSAIPQIAEFQEIAGEAEARNASFRVRTVPSSNGKKTFTYYELYDRDTNKVLTLGQHNEGDTLFPQRKYSGDHPKEGEFKPDNGWIKWEKPKEE